MMLSLDLLNGLLMIFLHLFLVTTYNSTALKANGITEDTFICTSFWAKKKFVSGRQTQEDLYLSPQLFCLFFFSLLGTHHHTSSTNLMDASWVRVLLLFLLFEPFVFYTHSATQEIYIHYYHPNDLHIYPLLCNKPIKDILQRRRVIFYWLIISLGWVKFNGPSPS